MSRNRSDNREPTTARRPGLAWEPRSGALWTVVNERDGLGDGTPPDYLTSVREGGFYGWPYCYWGRTVDDRVPQTTAAVPSPRSRPTTRSGGTPPRSASAGCRPARFPGFPEGMAIGQHGSWNRSKLERLQGRVRAVRRRPPRRATSRTRKSSRASSRRDEKFSYGRPVGVALGHDGSLLVADDVAETSIWRVTGPRVRSPVSVARPEVVTFSTDKSASSAVGSPRPEVEAFHPIGARRAVSAWTRSSSAFVFEPRGLA